MKGVDLAAGAGVVASAAVLVLAPAASGAQRVELSDARIAARAAVRVDPSYRVIRSTRPLRVRACWRVRRAVRCSLYRVAANPCALDGGDGVCAQVVVRRTWLVEVRQRRGRTAARIMRIGEQSG